MKIIITIAATTLALMLTGCTDNQLARQYGGNMTIQLPAGKKFVNATWKETQLWYSYRNARPGEIPEETTFKEKSTYGVFEGTVTFKESP